MSNDRTAALGDMAYFTGQALRCCEQLVDLEPSKHRAAELQQMAAVLRRLRGLARHRADESRRLAKQKAAA